MDLSRTKDHSVPRLHFYTPTPVQVADQRVLELQSVLDKYKNQLSRVQGVTSTAVSSTSTPTYTSSSVPLLTRDPKETILFLILLGDERALELLNKILKQGKITADDKDVIAEVSEKIVQQLLETQKALQASQVGLINRLLDGISNTVGFSTGSSEANISEDLALQSDAMNEELTKVFIGFITDAIVDRKDKANIKTEGTKMVNTLDRVSGDEDMNLESAEMSEDESLAPLI